MSVKPKLSAYTPSRGRDAFKGRAEPAIWARAAQVAGMGAQLAGRSEILERSGWAVPLDVPSVPALKERFLRADAEEFAEALYLNITGRSAGTRREPSWPDSVAVDGAAFLGRAAIAAGRVSVDRAALVRELGSAAGQLLLRDVVVASSGRTAAAAAATMAYASLSVPDEIVRVAGAAQVLRMSAGVDRLALQVLADGSRSSSETAREISLGVLAQSGRTPPEYTPHLPPSSGGGVGDEPVSARQNIAGLASQFDADTTSFVGGGANATDRSALEQARSLAPRPPAPDDNDSTPGFLTPQRLTTLSSEAGEWIRGAFNSSFGLTVEMAEPLLAEFDAAVNLIPPEGRAAVFSILNGSRVSGLADADRHVLTDLFPESGTLVSRTDQQARAAAEREKLLKQLVDDIVDAELGTGATNPTGWAAMLNSVRGAITAAARSNADRQTAQRRKNELEDASRSLTNLLDAR